jgi:hypothetical protein
MLSGGLVVMQLAKSRVRSLTSSSTLDLSARVLQELDRQLKLSTGQRDAIAEILAEWVAEVGPLRAEFRGKARTMVQTYRSRIGAQLREPQRDEFERMVEALLETWQLEAAIEPADEGRQ